MNLITYLRENKIQYSTLDDFVSVVIKIEDKTYLLVENTLIEENPTLFDEDFKLILNQDDFNAIEEYKIDYFLFCFGKKYYYSPVNKLDIQLNLFKYIGKCKLNYENSNYAFLGIHSGYELCNGSRLYEDWIKKAKFLGINKIGSCELNTLAGTLKLQNECKKNNIENILGETITVSDNKEQYELKLYVKNDIGWKNLLNINAQINVTNHGFVKEEFVLSHSEGLICVIPCSKKLTQEYIDLISESFDIKSLYYQIDLAEYNGNEKDKEVLLNIQHYLNQEKDKTLFVSPILLCDSYYLDKEDFEIKALLNKIGKVGFKYSSNDQYFKSLDDIQEQFESLFGDNYKQIFETSINNSNRLFEQCKDFKINTKELHLPKYEMTKEEKKKFKTNEDLFFDLIEKGFEEKIIGKVDDEDIYYKRFETELDIIKRGKLIDYFLILWDILNYCKREQILTGLGRGSAAGSIISYLMGITHLDPIKYKLLFERFLNEARLGSLPDIDCDFESQHRQKVISYIQEKYGFEFVCSIGAYGVFKLKSCIKDFGREFKIDIGRMNFITSLISDDDGEIVDMFKDSLIESKLKDFINDYSEMINLFHLILFQQKTKSIHAAAIVIVPKTSNSIYDCIPVRLEDNILVSEWDKHDIESAGYLKEDILGLTQLDKISDILKLVKKNKKIELDFYRTEEIVDDPEVMNLFKQGLNEDVFQFSTHGLKDYCKKLQPDNVEELVAANALYRPGAMDSNAHLDYIDIKFGNKEAEYDKYLEEYTKDTLGLYIYQEQVMMMFQYATGCTLTEADNFRKMISKSYLERDEVKINLNKNIFVTAYVKKGVTEDEALNVWNKMIAFALYSFNKSHAACYAVTGYYTQWLKFHYPLEFWATSLQYCKDSSEIVSKIEEIQKLGKIKVISPDINYSTENFEVNYKNDTIYWSISSIKYLAEKGIQFILEERNKNGLFKSFDDFVIRSKARAVNSRVVVNLILCGLFDQIEKINNVTHRYDLLKKYYDSKKRDIGELVDLKMIHKSYYWGLLSKDLCGYGFIDFDRLVKDKKKFKAQYASNEYILSLELNKDDAELVLCCGTVEEIKEFNTRKGKMGRVSINNNGFLIDVTIWPNIYEQMNNELTKKLILCITGDAKLDTFRDANKIIVQTNYNTQFELL